MKNKQTKKSTSKDEEDDEQEGRSRRQLTRHAMTIADPSKASGHACQIAEAATFSWAPDAKLLMQLRETHTLIHSYTRLKAANAKQRQLVLRLVVSWRTAHCTNLLISGSARSFWFARLGPFIRWCALPTRLAYKAWRSAQETTKED